MSSTTTDSPTIGESHAETTRAALELRRENAAKGDRTPAQRVPVNMYETDSALVVVAPLPGVMPDDVEIVVTPGHLRIDARLRSGAGRAYLLEEWTYGPYTRTVDIPVGWGASGQATLANGQLALRLLAGEPTAEGAVVAVRPGGADPAP